MNNNKYIWAVLLLCLVIAILGLFSPKLSEVRNEVRNLGNVTQSFWDTSDGYKVDGVEVIGGTGKLTIGTTGTILTQSNFGLCYIVAYASTIAATSTASVDCQATAAWDAGDISALTGVQANDVVNATLSTTTAGTTVGGLALLGAGASTTAGYITLRLSNLTGTTFTWPTTGNATGTAYYHSSR